MDRDAERLPIGQQPLGVAAGKLPVEKPCRRITDAHAGEHRGSHHLAAVGLQVAFDPHDGLRKKLGSVPNLYATFAHSEYALGSYLAFQSAKSSITGKAREVVDFPAAPELPA